MSHCVSPPAQGVWYVLDDVVRDVLARLRVGVGDVDAARISGLVPVAAAQINNELDRVHPMTPAGTVDVDDVDEDADVTELLATNVTPDILEALARLTVELYRRGKTDINGNALNGSLLFDSTAPIDAVRSDLAPHKSRWGIA